MPRKRGIVEKVGNAIYKANWKATPDENPYKATAMRGVREIEKQEASEAHEERFNKGPGRITIKEPTTIQNDPKAGWRDVGNTFVPWDKAFADRQAAHAQDDEVRRFEKESGKYGRQKPRAR